MKRTSYRGISLREAKHVIRHQKYVRSESRVFRNGITAKPVYGQGVYMVNDIELAAQYAFCHAEAELQPGVVLKQEVVFENPLILNRNYGEKQLKLDAWTWKTSLFESMSHPSSERIGDYIKEYLLLKGYDGVISHLGDELIHYVSYFPEKQIGKISWHLSFSIQDLIV
ncbi:hypothetical protein ABES25_21035 [Bacillus gobiensis]|uniref:hypothetical protein n=1 Tax=Bacillus gobiensis TaxID=1441095 RepID=UPI003D2220FD